MIKTVSVAVAQLKRAAAVGADLKGELVAVVARPNPEVQANLFQVVDAGNFLDLSDIRKMIRIIPLLFGAAGKNEWH